MRRIAKQFAKNGSASPSPSPRSSASLPLRKRGARILAQCFMIWEIPTRAVRFLVPANGDGSMPVEQIAGMLAMHCLVLNRRLEDFAILVLPKSLMPANVAERARQLIAAGRSIVAEVKLTPSERSVLQGIARKLSNKEIAAKLNLSVRTVKFHVSSLLSKFDVPNRAALGRRIAVSRISLSAKGVLDAAASAVPCQDVEEQTAECLAT
jgi:DNA-binding CsgD family transcriptional regulator